MVFSPRHLCLCVSVHLAARSRDFSFTRAVLGSWLSRDGGGSTWPSPHPGEKGTEEQVSLQSLGEEPQEGGTECTSGSGKEKDERRLLDSQPEHLGWGRGLHGDAPAAVWPRLHTKTRVNCPTIPTPLGVHSPLHLVVGRPMEGDQKGVPRSGLL